MNALYLYIGTGLFGSATLVLVVLLLRKALKGGDE